MYRAEHNTQQLYKQLLIFTRCDPPAALRAKLASAWARADTCTHLRSLILETLKDHRDYNQPRFDAQRASYKKVRVPLLLASNRVTCADALTLALSSRRMR